LRTTFGIFDANDRWPAVARIAYKGLPPAPVNAAKTEVARIRGHHASAFEAAELRLPSRNIAKRGIIAANFDLCRAVHHHFHRAPAPVVVAATHDPRALRENRDRQDDCRK